MFNSKSASLKIWLTRWNYRSRTKLLWNDKNEDFRYRDRVVPFLFKTKKNSHKPVFVYLQVLTAPYLKQCWIIYNMNAISERQTGMKNYNARTGLHSNRETKYFIGKRLLNFHSNKAKQLCFFTLGIKDKFGR